MCAAITPEVFSRPVSSLRIDVVSSIGTATCNQRPVPGERVIGDETLHETRCKDSMTMQEDGKSAEN